MAEGRGGAQGQKYRISLGLPVGAVSAAAAAARAPLRALPARRWQPLPAASPPPPSHGPPPPPRPALLPQVIQCGDNSGAKNLYIMAVTLWGTRQNRLPAACVGDFCLASVKKGKPELRKKGACRAPLAAPWGGRGRAALQRAWPLADAQGPRGLRPLPLRAPLSRAPHTHALSHVPCPPFSSHSAPHRGHPPKKNVEAEGWHLHLL